MNYDHHYHAGCFADVIKHISLIGLLTCLTQKDKPLCYLETHAGIGRYDLTAAKIKNSKEFSQGILKIFHLNNVPSLVKNYFHAIHSLNHSHELINYPGSPYLAQYFTRPHDRLILCELSKPTYETLKQNFSQEKNIAIHHIDGYTALNAFLPPKEKRGLILIDPPYENTNEVTHLIASLTKALHRFNHGCYAIWYPIKSASETKKLKDGIKKQTAQPLLCIELCIYDELPTHLNGSGLIIINPPWQFDVLIEPILAWLWQVLSYHNQGGYLLTHL